MSDEMQIRLPDGSTRALATGTTASGLAKDIGSRLAKAAVIAVVNGEQRDLGTELHEGDEVAIVTGDSPEGLFTIRHSTTHVLAQAVLDLFPGATFGIGPPVEDGFYYDFELPNGGVFHEDDLERIDARMRQIIAESQPFVHDEMPADKAREVFAGHRFKLEIIDDASTDPMSQTSASESVRTYENPPKHPKDAPPFPGYPGFIDLCRGPHVPNTGYHLGHFKLIRVAGAYWRGQEGNPQLQRIYGTAWDSKKALEEHLHRLEEAAKRDHRKLGVELDLFSFPDELGSGLAVFHPKGGLVRRLMEDYSRKRHEEAGYEFVNSPHITKSTLFETSGHLDWFADGMFPPIHFDDEGGAEGQDYYLKPMNCPFHILIFKSRMRSYRELPLRMFEFGTVYRYEKSGVIHGLTRVRGMTQDDAHIFTTKENMAEELASLLDFVLGLLADYGLSEFYLELSTKPPGKAVGTDEEWEEATEALRAVASAKDLDLVLDEGGGAFYGPKISVQARDAIGRTWQLSTIQVDFQLPQRFEMEYVGADNERHRPIMIHRALFGSIERFFGVLVEHYAGAFPAWLAPVQVRVLPVRSDHHAYAARVVDRLVADGFRADLVEADEPLGARIRKAKLEKLPYVLVVGDQDVEAGTVGVNARGGDQPERDVAVDDFAARLAAEVTREPDPVPLDHLWATWRSAYVGQVVDTRSLPTPEEAAGRSLFERIYAAADAEGDGAAGILWRGPTCFALLNLYPYTAGHLMVLPNRAVSDLEALTDAEHTELWGAVRDAVVALKAAFRCDAVNVGINLGAAAGGSQSDHLHVHCVPRWEGDANFIAVAADAVLPISLAEAGERLRAAWPV